MTAFDMLKEQAGWLIVGIAAVLSWAVKFKGKVREDKVDGAAGNATVNRIDKLVHQADEEYEKRLKGEQRISELDAENHRLGHELADARMQIRFLQADVRRMKKIILDLAPDAAKYLGTAPGALDDKES